MIDEIGNLCFTTPTYKVLALTEAPFLKLGWYSSDQECSSGHSFITTHVGFCREVASTHVHHDFASSVHFSCFLFAVSPLEIIHSEPGRERLDDSSSSGIMAIAKLAHPSYLQCTII